MLHIRLLVNRLVQNQVYLLLHTMQTNFTTQDASGLPRFNLQVPFTDILSYRNLDVNRLLNLQGDLMEIRWEVILKDGTVFRFQYRCESTSYRWFLCITLFC